MKLRSFFGIIILLALSTPSCRKGEGKGGKATISGKVVPMMCGSAFKNKGVQSMLDMVMEILPSPLDVDAIVGTNPNTQNEESRKPAFEAPFSALAFKIATDPYVGRLCFTRAYSGILEQECSKLVKDFFKTKRKKL